MKDKIWVKNKLLSYMVVCLLFCMGGYTTTQAGEWNEKPIMCAERNEVFDAITERNEIMLFSATTYSKVRNEFGTLDRVPAKLPFSFYVNFKTGTYTVTEYHESYNTYCVVAYGVDLKLFVGGIK